MKRREQRKERIEELRAAGFKYITRAQHGELIAHKKKPVRQQNYWESDRRCVVIAEIDLFDSLCWTDEAMYIGNKKKGATE